jgi:hypothetical protein
MSFDDTMSPGAADDGRTVSNTHTLAASQGCSASEGADQQAVKIEALKAQVKAMTLQLAVLHADVAGLDAVLDAFKRFHASSPLMAATGHHFRSGNVKRRITVLYEAAFDGKARELGIVNPVQHRAD